MTSYNQRFKNLTKEYIQDNLVVHQEEGRWGVNIEINGVEVFHECTVDPAVPDTLTHLVRSCSGKSTIKTCPADFRAVNETIIELCHSYTAMVFEPNAAYRNVHCAICNNASLEKLICYNLGPLGRTNWQSNFNLVNFAVLFDLSGDVQDKVGFEHKCQQGELYDPFFKKCRNVICGQDGMEFRQGRCIDTRIPVLTSSSSSTDGSASNPLTTTLSSSRFAFTTTQTSHDDDDDVNIIEIIEISNDTIEELFEPADTTTVTETTTKITTTTTAITTTRLVRNFVVK